MISTARLFSRSFLAVGFLLALLCIVMAWAASGQEPYQHGRLVPSKETKTTAFLAIKLPTEFQAEHAAMRATVREVAYAAALRDGLGGEEAEALSIWEADRLEFSVEYEHGASLRGVLVSTAVNGWLFLPVTKQCTTGRAGYAAIGYVTVCPPRTEGEVPGGCLFPHLEIRPLYSGMPGVVQCGRGTKRRAVGGRR